MNAKVVILRGLPGSGKSTWANAKIAAPGAVTICSADHHFETPQGYKFVPQELAAAHQLCMMKFETALFVHAGENAPFGLVIVDNTNVTNRDMRYYVDRARHFGFQTEIITFNGGFQSVHNVPESSMARMRSRWEEVAPEWHQYLKEPY